MSNTSTTNNTNQQYRRPAPRKVNSITHKFGHIVYVRNPKQEQGSRGGVDVLSTHTDAVVFGVCAQGMPMGMARRIFDTHPEVYAAYQTAYRNNALGTGSVIGCAIPLESGAYKWFIAIVTKQDTNDVPALSAIIDGLRTINAYIQDGTLQIRNIAMPKIGCGKGQLDWSDVSRVFAHELAAFTIPVAIVALKYEDEICVEIGDEIETYSTARAIDIEKQRRMDAPRAQAAVIMPAPEKPKRTRKPRVQVSEVREEPTGMFQDMPAEVGISATLD